MPWFFGFGYTFKTLLLMSGPPEKMDNHCNNGKNMFVTNEIRSRK